MDIIHLQSITILQDAFAEILLSRQDEGHTCYGEVFSDVVKAMCSYKQLVAVGINCSPPQYIEVDYFLCSMHDFILQGLLDSVSGCSLPLIVYPNSGEGWCSTG